MDRQAVCTRVENALLKNSPLLHLVQLDIVRQHFTVLYKYIQYTSIRLGIYMYIVIEFGLCCFSSVCSLNAKHTTAD